MRSSISLLTSVLMFTCFMEARADANPPERPSPEIPAAAPPNPNHLEPIPAYGDDGYNQAVFKSLVWNGAAKNGLPEAWMIGKPSFSPEYAVIIWGKERLIKPKGPNQTGRTSKFWVVEYVVPKKQIWQWKELPDGSMEQDIKVTKEVDRNSVEIPSEFAEPILKAWKSVLQQTRYSKDHYQGNRWRNISVLLPLQSIWGDLVTLHGNSKNHYRPWPCSRRTSQIGRHGS